MVQIEVAAGEDAHAERGGGLLGPGFEVMVVHSRIGGAAVGADGKVEELAENGLFLGPFRHASYQNVRVAFEPGDRMLAYTDGIIEASLADGEPLGAAGLRKFAEDHVRTEPEAFAEALIRSVSIREQEDDLTVVVAQLLAKGH